MSNTVILIPSRLAATRLPNKPLLKINNISIINHVYKIAKSSLIGESYVATGDKEIFEEVTKFGGKCILTKKDHKTGTDRIFEAYQELRDDNIEYVINLQGDEPMLDIEDVHNLLKKTIRKKSKISTLACQIEDKKFFLNKKSTGVLPITHKEMTRFNISLEDGCQMVFDAIQNAWGGELFVPKIPSYRILDVAQAIAPNCKYEEVGIRPGEKLHEEMISVEDSPFTFEYKD